MRYIYIYACLGICIYTAYAGINKEQSYVQEPNTQDITTHQENEALEGLLCLSIRPSSTNTCNTAIDAHTTPSPRDALFALIHQHTQCKKQYKQYVLQYIDQHPHRDISALSLTKPDTRDICVKLKNMRNFSLLLELYNRGLPIERANCHKTTLLDSLFTRSRCLTPIPYHLVTICTAHRIPITMKGMKRGKKCIKHLWQFCNASPSVAKRIIMPEPLLNMMPKKIQKKPEFAET